MTREVINEGSAFAARVRFFGTSNVASVPATARYRVKDVTNDRVVIDWTELTPAHEIEVEISADDNGIYMDGSRPFQRFEERVLVIQANYSTNAQYAEEIRYLIKNLRGFDS